MQSTYPRHAEPVRAGWNLGDALDGEGSSGDCHDSRAKSSAHRVHPICNAVTAGGEAWTLAAVLHQMGMRYPLPFVALAA